MSSGSEEGSMAADATKLVPVRHVKEVTLPPLRSRDVVAPPNTRHPAPSTSQREILRARLA
jgi:hypothetical protein